MRRLNTRRFFRRNWAFYSGGRQILSLIAFVLLLVALPLFVFRNQPEQVLVGIGILGVLAVWAAVVLSVKAFHSKEEDGEAEENND